MLSSQNPNSRTGIEASNINSCDTCDQCGAMRKLKEVFVCQNCGAASPKWQGQCAACGEWNTLVGEAAASAVRHPKSGAARAARPDSSTSLAAEAVAEQPRMATGSAELDRVLGGGLVVGSVTLLGGDPVLRQSSLILPAPPA